MNLYLIISETLTTIDWEDRFSYLGHEEEYRIWELVVARNHSQARYLAWKTDKSSFTDEMRDMPRFTCRLRKKDIDLPAGVIHDISNPKFAQYWDHPDKEVTLP